MVDEAQPVAPRMAIDLGLGVTAFVHVTMERGHMRDVEKFRATIVHTPEVLECHAVTGDFDYALKVVTPDLKALSAFPLSTLVPPLAD